MSEEKIGEEQGYDDCDKIECNECYEENAKYVITFYARRVIRKLDEDGDFDAQYEIDSDWGGYSPENNLYYCEKCIKDHGIKGDEKKVPTKIIFDKE